MENNTSFLSTLAVTLPLSICVCAIVAYFYYWGEGIREKKMHAETIQLQIETIRANSCYREYEWSDAHKIRWVSVDYCVDTSAKEETND